MIDLQALASSIRFGFATNSSSSHSILLVGRDAAARVHGDGWEVVDRGEYGWEWFALAEREEKADYLWTMLVQQVEDLLRPDGPAPTRYTIPREWGAPDPHEGHAKFARAVATRVLEHEPADLGEGTGIDHQSTFSFPLDPDTRVPHVGFARWIRDRVLDDGVVVYGGNDNDSAGYEPVPTRGEEVVPLERDEFCRPFTCFDRGDHWLLFRKQDGTKLRLPKVAGAEITHSTVLELADIKITDACSMGCAYCYQGSTPRGKHPTMTFYEMVEVVKHLGVREVAIGGGEPLEYPDFWNLVRQLREHVVVNITTRRLDLIPPWKLDLFGGIGLSVDSAQALHRVLAKVGVVDDAALSSDNPWRSKLVVHVVLGTVPMDEVVAICTEARDQHLPVLLLAYKRDGRGAEFAPHSYDDWIQRLRTAFRAPSGWWTGPSIGVDTPIVDEWGGQIADQLTVDPRLMSPGEGQFSLYVDFVTETFARASYGGTPRTPFVAKDPKDWRHREKVAAHIVETFRGWHNG